MKPALPAGGVALPCQRDPELFFTDDPEEIDRARALCRGCALRLDCLTGAVQRGEPFGVWGGELFQHGMVIPGKRPRGRPRKADIAA